MRLIRDRRIPRCGRALLVLLACVGPAGCASHAQQMARVRAALRDSRADVALAEFNKSKKKSNDLLYLLERGYLEYEAGQYTASNRAFEAAERRAEELYTKSVTGELASLVTNDKILPYRGYPYELVMIHYYRVLNYLALDAYDDALVEARKANQRLAELASARENKAGYKNDAFMQYLTGLLYQNAGETNDAAVSLRAARAAYREYRELYGIDAPGTLAADLYRALVALGSDDETDALTADDPDLPSRAMEGQDANVVLFVESGFIPYLEAVNIVLPIYKDKADDQYRNCDDCSERYARILVERYRNDIYSYSGSRFRLDHVLRFAFPRLVDYPTEATWTEIVAPVSRIVPLEPVQPLGAIVHREFEQRLPGLLLKTIARALVKEFARTRAKKKSSGLGALVNIVNVATEEADTRSWLFLPEQINMIKLTLPPGTDTLTVVFHDRNDDDIDEQSLVINVQRGRTTFCRVRSYR